MSRRGIRRDAVAAAAAAQDQEATALARRLDRLIRTVHPTDRGPYTLREISAGVHDQTDGAVTISTSYLSQLRSGARTTVSAEKLAAVARFFGVPVAHLVDGAEQDSDRLDADLALATALKERGVQEVALRAADLTPDGLRALTQMLDTLAQLPGMTYRTAAPALPARRQIRPPAARPPVQASRGRSRRP